MARLPSGPSWRCATPPAPTGGVTITPDNSGQGVSGQTKTYAHTVTVGSVATAVNLSASLQQELGHAHLPRHQQQRPTGWRRDPDQPAPLQLPMPARRSWCRLTSRRALRRARWTTPRSRQPPLSTTRSLTPTRDTTRVGSLISVTPNNGLYATAASVVFYSALRYQQRRCHGPDHHRGDLEPGLATAAVGRGSHWQRRVHDPAGQPALARPR